MTDEAATWLKLRVEALEKNAIDQASVSNIYGELVEQNRLAIRQYGEQFGGRCGSLEGKDRMQDGRLAKVEKDMQFAASNIRLDEAFRRLDCVSVVTDNLEAAANAFVQANASDHGNYHERLCKLEGMRIVESCASMLDRIHRLEQNFSHQKHSPVGLDALDAARAGPPVYRPTPADLELGEVWRRNARLSEVMTYQELNEERAALAAKLCADCLRREWEGAEQREEQFTTIIRDALSGRLDGMLGEEKPEARHGVYLDPRCGAGRHAFVGASCTRCTTQLADPPPNRDAT